MIQTVDPLTSHHLQPSAPLGRTKTVLKILFIHSKIFNDEAEKP
jgi:hypothetical protein